jgi:hypothetical protein
MFRVSLQTDIDSVDYLQPMAFPTEAQAMSYAVGIVKSRPPWTTCPTIRVTEPDGKSTDYGPADLILYGAIFGDCDDA